MRIAAILLLLVPVAQEGDNFGFGDQGRVDEAIKRGIGFLSTAPSPGGHGHAKDSDPLILLTLLHAEVPLENAVLQKYLKQALDAKLERTYQAALLAMCLEELDRVGHQKKIVECAQFLVDNQCSNGQWSYGEATGPVKDDSVASGLGLGGEKSTASAAGSAAGRRVKPPVKNHVSVTKKRDGPATGDNSNSQYAALGIRACNDAGVHVGSSVISRARGWWVQSQHSDPADGKQPAVASGGGGAPRGWCYCAKDSHKAYGSMTAGAVSALVIYDHILRRKWQQDAAVKDGMTWLAKNFSVTQNPGPCQHEGGNPNAFVGYFLYGIERVGMLYGTVKIGEKFWYLDGAEHLLKIQRGDGSWHMSHVPRKGPWGPDHPTWDTCFAILFLKRATRPLVASTDDRK